MNIQILDCTLRDGGYINNWSFTDKEIFKTIEALEKSNIDIIECGYLNEKKGKKNNSTLFKNLEVLDALLTPFSTRSQKVVMINFGDYDVNKLIPKNETVIDGIRLAFHKENLEEALIEAEKIVSLGYKLFFQPMVTKRYSDLEFLELIDRINQLELHAFYVVDSFGSMTLNEFQKYVVLANSNLNAETILGYHAHNNMQLAFSNAISMCGMNMKRDIVIDSSIYGIGRGAGNLNSELITDFLNVSQQGSYDTLPMLEIIDSYLESLMRENPWGFSPAQFLSATYNCHPNYATYLINKNTNHIVGIKKILEKLSEEQKSSFNKESIETLYMDALLEEKSSPIGEFNIPKDKQVLLCASGRTVKEYLPLIENKIQSENYLIIALNHRPSFECDYYFFSNQKRFDKFSSEIPLDKIVVTSNIKVEHNLKYVLDFKSLVYVDNIFISNVALIMLNYLIHKKIKSVALVGLDGYSNDTVDNYSYNETSIILNEKEKLVQNEILEKSLIKLSQRITLDFITPSIFNKNKKLKILGVIPARYKSSRFEGKPLCLIKDIPMIKRTYTQAKKSMLLDELLVATESKDIQRYCEEENIPVVMTSDRCLTGTDRLAEVAEKEYFDLYVNIQGDEPVIDPISIDEVVEEFQKYGDEYIAYNLYKSISLEDEVNSNTIIKVINNEKDELMYMSRLGIPFNKSDNEVTFKKQVCVYGFTKKALELFTNRDKTLNEKFEDIEILRFIDMGYKVKMKETKVDSIAVDVPSDIKKVEDFLNEKGLA